MESPRQTSRVRSKLLAATLAVFLLTAVIILSIVAWLNHSSESARLAEMEHLITSHIASKAKVLVDNHALALTGLVADNALSDIQALVHRAMEQDEDLVYGLFVGSDGQPWAYANAESRGAGPLPPDAVLRRWTEVSIPEEGWTSRAPGQRLARINGVDVFEVSRPVLEHDELLGTIRYGFSSAPLERALAGVRAESLEAKRQLLLWLLLGVAVSTLLGAVAIARIARHITEPLNLLTRAANDIADGKEQVRVDVRSNDELQLLGAAFNHMQAANEEAMHQLKSAMDAALEASRLKSEFLANMSHEIRTPMNGVIGMLRLMLRLPLDGKLRRYAETADTSASALMTIINDVLDFSKMEAGKYELQSVPYDPGVVLQGVAELFAGRAHERGLELIYHRARDVPREVVGDPDRYRQILNNLVGNAVKFTTTGEVFIELSVDRAAADHCVLRTVVHDTGIGIAEEDQEALFDAFSQVDGTMVREYGGTGLGLAISKRLVEMMGGQIGVSSERGIGSKFWFTLSVGVCAEVEPEPCTVPVAKRALIVEDCRRWARVIEEYMGQWGLSTQTVPCGKPALEKLRSGETEEARFDVIVVGTRLRDLGLADFIARLRGIPTAKSLPLVVLTQLGEGATLTELESEITAQISKPLRPSELYDCLVGVFTGQTRKSGPSSQHFRAPQRTGLSILIVDDNAINRFVATEQVEQAGYEPATAENGKQAFEMVQAGDYAAVLMDCQMPVMDGYTAASKIREWEAGKRRVPIIALTAHAMPGEREKVLRAGMDDYLSKPLRPHSLERMLRRHVALGSNPPGSTQEVEDAVSSQSQGQGQGPGPAELDMDIDRSRKLVDLFLTKMPAQLEGLEDALQTDRLDLLSQRAHKVKGGCLALGAEAMAESAEWLQRNATSADRDHVVKQVEETKRRFEVVRRLLGVEHPSLLPPAGSSLSTAPSASA